ncbi:MAG: nitroreductase [Chitinophagales bacterium]
MNERKEILKTIIETRRSVKPGFYSAEKVDDAVIHAMLESARWAPTHGLTEPWHFVVFTGEGLQKLAEFLSSSYKQQTSLENFLQAKHEKIISNILKASHIILVGMKRQLNGKIPEVEEICAVACSVQNMLLTAHTHGVGAYWSTGSMSTHETTKKIMNLQEADRCMGMIYVGNYAGEVPVPARTKIFEKAVWMNE